MDIKSPPRQRGLRLLLAALVMGLSVGSAGMYSQVRASDHDDGETNIKGRNLNITDVYAFREDWQTGNAADASNLVLIMNSNPRSVPRQQYFFNTSAKYNFNIGRQTNSGNQVTGKTDVQMAFSFGAPDSNSQQAITLALTSNGNTVNINAGKTNPAPILLSNQTTTSNNPTINTFSIGNNTVKLFAGLREDPFFFDVDAYFRTRAFLASNKASVSANPLSAPGFAKDASTAVDFTIGFNVNTIVVSVPIAALQSSAGERTFDVWSTITLPSNIASFQ